MNGRHVVRLKIGDPFVFGRGGEEVLEFREFGVEPSIIPVSRYSFVVNVRCALIYGNAF
jgi:siroheme synthase